MKLTYASVCSGIEAASVAWHPLGWRGVFVSEIEPFPCAVLAHRWPQIPNLGDMTQYEKWFDAILDVLVGGTPCQSFSIAGLRKGLDDPRGNLMLTFGAIAAKYRPRWLVWENVPGVLSSNGGRDFAAFLGLITGQQVEPPVNGWENSGILQGIASAYGVAWRVLDAQYFGVAQRRRRVFVVGHLGGLWQRAAAVLFERESLCGNPPPRREAGKGFTHSVAPSIGASGRGFERGGETRGQDPVVAVACDEVATPLMAGSGHEAGHNARSGHCKDSHIVGVAQPIPINMQAATKNGNKSPNMLGIGQPGDPAMTLGANDRHAVAQPTPFDTQQITSKANRTKAEPGMPASTLNQAGQMHVALPIGIDGGEVGYALRANASHSGDKGDGGVNTTMVAEIAGTLKSNSGGGGFGSDPSETFIPVDAPLGAGPDARAGRMRGREGCAGGGKGPLLSEEKSLTIAAAANDQVLFQPVPAWPAQVAPTLNAAFGDKQGLEDQHALHGAGCFVPGGRHASGMAVRRLTPRECERLQGFPDDYTLIPFRKKPAADGPRYKSLGNSMAIPCMRWIGLRIELVESIFANQ